MFDAATRVFYGHIVAGSTTSRIAYVVSAQEVFDDIEGRLTQLVRPISSEHHPFRAPQVQLSSDEDGLQGSSDSIVYKIRTQADKYVTNYDGHADDKSLKQRNLPGTAGRQNAWGSCA